MIHKLAIRFTGVSTHFRGVVAGVPHRVVLPDASSARMGSIQIGTEPPRHFGLMPHIAMLTLPNARAEQQPLTIAKILQAGVVQKGVRLQIVNAIDSKLAYHDFDKMQSLGRYVPFFNFSSDVVLGGRAAVYFDLFGGEVRSEPVRDGAVQTVVTVRTEGPADLLVTPFGPAEEAGEPAGGEGAPEQNYRFGLTTDELIVGNHDIFPDISPGYDYLWHFLAMRGGIPQRISMRTPGMPDPENELDEKVLVTAWQRHHKIMRQVQAGDTTGIPPFADVASQPSCSDARYP